MIIIMIIVINNKYNICLCVSVRMRVRKRSNNITVNYIIDKIINLCSIVILKADVLFMSLL